MGSLSLYVLQYPSAKYLLDNRVLIEGVFIWCSANSGSSRAREHWAERRAAVQSSEFWDNTTVIEFVMRKFYAAVKSVQRKGLTLSDLWITMNAFMTSIASLDRAADMPMNGKPRLESRRVNKLVEVIRTVRMLSSCISVWVSMSFIRYAARGQELVGSTYGYNGHTGSSFQSCCW